MNTPSYFASTLPKSHKATHFKTKTKVNANDELAKNLIVGKNATQSLWQSLELLV